MLTKGFYSSLKFNFEVPPACPPTQGIFHADPIDLSYVDEVRVVGLQSLSFEHRIETPPAVLPVSAGRILNGVAANERGKRNLELNCEKKEREKDS